MPLEFDSLEIVNLYPSDIFKLAICKSGLTAAQVAGAMDVGEAVITRTTSDDTYAPTFSKLPLFCRAVNNTLVIDWLYEKANLSGHLSVLPINCSGLQKTMLDFGKEVGDVFEKVQDAIKDGELTKKELRAIQREVLQALACLTNLSSQLRAAEMKVSRR